MTCSLMIRNARLRDGSDVDIAIADGRYVEIAPQLPQRGQIELDADGRLVTESFVIGQLHLDKVFTGSWLGEEAKTEYFDEGAMGGAMTSIELAARVKERYGEEECYQRVARALELAVQAGVSHVRAFVDVDSKARLIGMRACLRAREAFRDRIQVQVIAFPQDGVLREPGALDLVRESLELGADVVGGIPWLEYTDADITRHVDLLFDLAREHDKDVSMLVDDAGDPGLRSLETLALRTISHGWQGRVVACHARAMSAYTELYHRKVVHLLREAQIGIVTNPHTGPLHVRVKDLVAAGVPIALGGESVYDAYYPYGRCNMLEVAFVVSHALWAMAPGDWELLYDATTTVPARMIGLANHRIAVGHPANLVVLQHRDLRDALSFHQEPRYVIHQGRLVAESIVETVLHPAPRDG